MSKLFAKPLFFSIPLRWVLIVPFVVQIVGAVSLVGYFSYQSGQKAVNHLADHLMTEVGDRVDQHLDSYLGNAQAVNQMNLDAVKSGVLDLNNFQGLGQYFYRQARAFNFSYVNFGGVDGSFIGAGNSDPNQFEIAEISSGNTNLIRVYEVKPTGDRGALRETIKNPQTNNRAWYLEAVKARKPIWSKVYSWGDLPDHISLSASAPVFDQRQQLQGVLGVDLELSQISHFLQTLATHPEANIFIVDRSGLLIASSEQEQITSLLKGKVQRKAAIAAQNPLTREVTKSLIQKFGTLTAISDQNFPMDQRLELPEQPPVLVKVSPYQDKYGLDWLIVTIVPEQQFLNLIQENIEQTIFLCSLTLLVAIALGILTAYGITRPIKQLGRASAALAKGQWQDTLSENSTISELQKLSISFNQMAVQLRQSFTQVEEELQGSRTMYQRVVQTQTDFILRSQPDTTITFANEALCRVLGQNLEQIIGQKWLDFANPDDIASTLEQISQLTLTNPSFVAENRDQRAGGQIGWTQWINQGLFNEQGELIEIQSVGRDITALKEAETKLRENQRFIERITEASPSLLYIYDHIAERNIYSNRSVADILGYSAAEIQAMGADLFNIICHPEDLSKLYEGVQKICALENDDEIVEIEYRVIDAQGNWHWLLSRDLVFSRTEDGRVWQTLGNAQDISDRKLAELAIWKVQNFLNSIIENIPDMVFVKDAKDLKFISFNKAGEELLGYSREELLGKNDLDLFTPEQAEFFINKDRQVLAEGNVLDIPQETIQTKAQEIRILHTKKIPIFDELGQAQYLLGISEDITELLESENRLTQIARHIPGVIYQFRMRPDGTFHFPYASEGIQQIYGVTPQQVRENAAPVLAVLYPEDLERVYESILDSATNLTPWHVEYRVCLPDNRTIWVVGDSTPKRQEDGSIIWHGYIADISDRKRVEMALRESETKFSTIFQNSPDPVWIALFESGYFIDVNNSLCEFLNTTKSEIMGKTCVELGVWNNLEDLEHLKTILAQEGGVQNFEIIINTVTNETKTVLISAVRVILGGQDCVITVMKDISARKRTEILLIQAKERAEQAESKLQKTQRFLQRANQQLINLANLDPLTKIANRRCFNTHLKKEWRRLYREQQPLSLILFDVDFFKKFNDSFGHPEGDRCLINIAQTAKKTVGRSTDLVARIGGEEFAVVLPNTDLNGAKAIAEKLRLAIQALDIPHSNANNCVTISLGITSQIPDENNLPAALIDQADQALFLAKDWGRNQFVIFAANPT